MNLEASPKQLLWSFFGHLIVSDRAIMSPFINQWPFYPQTSLEKLPRTAPPLTEISML
jgi:hypothetical protein